MRDVLTDIERWLEQGEQVALATVVRTWGSAPRREGANMALTAQGAISGSVSGGCVEGAVVEAGFAALEKGRPELLHFGVADETAWEVGLACGGSIDVYVEPLDREHFEFVRRRIVDDVTVATATIVKGEAGAGKLSMDADGARLGELGGLQEEVLAAARAALEQAASRGQTIGTDADELQIFVEVVAPSPKIVIVGGVHIAVALSSLARTLDYKTIVVDPRRAFGSEARFPEVDRLIQAWPEEAFADLDLNSSTAVATLTHDPKIDDPALQLALRSGAFYVGALGSQKTQAKRRTRLKEAGLSDAQIERLHGPIGLDLGGATPEEIALAVMAQIVEVRNLGVR